MMYLAFSSGLFISPPAFLFLVQSHRSTRTSRHATYIESRTITPRSLPLYLGVY